MGKNWDFFMGCSNNIFLVAKNSMSGFLWDVDGIYVNINVVGYQLSIGNEEVSRNIL